MTWDTELTVCPFAPLAHIGGWNSTENRLGIWKALREGSAGDNEHYLHSHPHFSCPPHETFSAHIKVTSLLCTFLHHFLPAF